MRFGYSCINTKLNSLKHKISLNRTCRKRFASRSRLSELCLSNSADLIKILRWNEANSIRFFRISSDMFPWMDHPELGYKISDLNFFQETIHNMELSGIFAKTNNHKLEAHPGPFCCLGSPNEDVVNKTILCLEMHNIMGDLMGLDNKFKINIHIGGSYGGDFLGTAKRFCKNFHKLSKGLKNRLTVENDDKSSMWSVDLLYKYIYEEVGIPIVFDYHHWQFCNNGGKIEEDCRLCLSTWGHEDGVPTCHYSESSKTKKPQAHSDLIDGPILDFGNGIDYDIMIEAKLKEQAVLQYLSKSKEVDCNEKVYV